MPKCIIVVDDDKEIREIVSFVLDHHGFKVDAVSNSQHLYHLLTSYLPDLIILDVMIPGEDGYRICSGLRSTPQTSHIPIMIMTAHTEDIYQRISVDLGASQHITKPFHPLDLAQKVMTLLHEDV